nr:retrovirus-related Pol polyprotein from transposon TNT 1-94 [Tanacetum cinerariifolium]
MIQVKEIMQDKDLKNSKSNDEGSRSRSQSMNDQSHYKQAKTKTNEKTRQPPTRMFSVVQDCQYKRSSLQQQRSLMKETSTLGEIVSLNLYISRTRMLSVLLVKVGVVKKPDLPYLYIFGALCYPTNDGEDLGKLKPKADIGIFIGYALIKKAFRIYNKRTWMIIKTIHVDFDELTMMASKQFSSGPEPKLLTPGTISRGLMPNIPSLTPYVSPTMNDWEIFFQPMFDEYINPSSCVDLKVRSVIALKHVISTGTLSSTTIDQDAQSSSTSQTT